MSQPNPLRHLIWAGYGLAGALALWLTFRFLLPWTLPFLIALGLSSLLERPTRWLMDRLRLPRWGAAVACTVALAAVLCAGLLGLGWRAAYELWLLFQRLPGLLASLPSLGQWTRRTAYRFIIAAPAAIQPMLWEVLEGAMAQLAVLPQGLYTQIPVWAATALHTLPDLGLFLFTTALATYFSLAERPALLAFLRRQLPPAWRGRTRQGIKRLRATFGRWLRAQGTLMLITFSLLAVGFLLLGFELPVLLAGLTALVDALPVFGTGTVLLPWALGELLTGHPGIALALAALYALVSLVRGVLEPKLVGDRVGLPPLGALLAMYVGFQALGVAGMILAPLAAMFLKELHDCGILRLWR